MTGCARTVALVGPLALGSVSATAVHGLIAARGKGGFLVVMTVRSGRAPEVRAVGEGSAAEVRVGGQTIGVRGGQIELSR